MEGTAAALVHALKYGGWRALSGPMGEAMAPAARPLVGDARSVALVPVPLAAARLRERGFNQALLLAGSLAGATGWPVWQGLARRRTGRRQASLGRAARAENVRSLFEVRSAEAREDASRTALLVDDVLTTGATAAACAVALEEAGTPCAGVVSFARASTPLEGPGDAERRPSGRAASGAARAGGTLRKAARAVIRRAADARSRGRDVVDR